MAGRRAQLYAQPPHGDDHPGGPGPAREDEQIRLPEKVQKDDGPDAMAELRFQRLDRARSLLQHTNLPVKAIAPQVGIGDEFQLSKLFRGHFGRTPSEVRRLGLPK